MVEFKRNKKKKKHIKPLMKAFNKLMDLRIAKIKMRISQLG